MEKTLDKQDSKSSQSERPGILGGLAQRLQEGVRATIVALGQSHAQRLAALVESSDDAILSVDLDATIATWNRGAEELFGYAPEEIVGKSVTILIPADRQDEEPKILERVGRGEHVQHYETVRLRKDGRSVPVSLSVSPIMDTGGTIIGACKIARDMTERKRAEEALAKRADEQAALYEFTDRLFRAGSVVDIYEAALDSIVRALGCERASILLFDDSGVMKFVAWRGLSDHYRQAVEGHSPWTRETKNPEPISIGDIDSAELDSSLKATVKAEGIAALAFIPLTARGELVGKFMTYYRDSARLHRRRDRSGGHHCASARVWLGARTRGRASGERPKKPKNSWSAKASTASRTRLPLSRPSPAKPCGVPKRMICKLSSPACTLWAKPMSCSPVRTGIGLVAGRGRTRAEAVSGEPSRALHRSRPSGAVASDDIIDVDHVPA